MSLRSQLNNADLSALLASRSQMSGLLNSQLLGNTGLASLGFSSSSSATNSDILTLLLRQQAEEQQKLILAQQLGGLAGLTGYGSLPIPPPPADNLSLLIQQKKLQQLQSLTGVSSMDQLAALRALGSSDLSLLGSQSASQLDALNKILLTQQQAPVSVNNALASLPGAQQAVAGLNLPSMDRKRKGRTGTFPQKLHQILLNLERQEGGAEIASFLPHGRAFAIHKPREFVKQVMPKYFRMSRFSSFQRQLNLYDFQRVTEGPDKGAYYHELFVQGRPILSTMMKRNKIKGIKNDENDDESKAEEEDEHANDAESS